MFSTWPAGRHHQLVVASIVDSSTFAAARPQFPKELPPWKMLWEILCITLARQKLRFLKFKLVAALPPITLHGVGDHFSHREAFYVIHRFRTV